MRAPIRKLPGYELLHSLLAYSPNTGELVWKWRAPLTKHDKIFNSTHAGRAAGGLSQGRPDGSNRYCVVGFNIDGCSQQFQAHRIIFKMMTGEEPPDILDHEDGNNLNLRWNNFRNATTGQNIQNSKLRKDNKSGIKGVSWDSSHKKWRATISVDGTFLRLGRFETVAEAAFVVNAERVRLHGKFARTK